MRGALEARHGRDLMNRVMLERLQDQPFARLGQAPAPKEIGKGSIVGLQHIAKITGRDATMGCYAIACEIRARQVLLYARLNVRKPFVNEAAGGRAAGDTITDAVRD